MASSVIQPADIREVAVIGLGLMGSGIAELVARSGLRVVAIEINQAFLDQGMARLRASLDKAATMGLGRRHGRQGDRGRGQAGPEHGHLPGQARILR